MYFGHMLAYIKQGRVQVAPLDERSENLFYLPHHAVKKRKRNTTKWRTVFDASSHERGYPSWNDALEIGTNLLLEILATLLRFRLHKRAVICDGSQALLQLTLHENDRDLTAWSGMTTATSRRHVTSHNIVLFPSHLALPVVRSICQLRSELAVLYCDRYPTAAALLNKSTFTDDFAATVEDDNHVITVYYELTALLESTTLPPSKRATNSL
jgi:hypothetical protein